MVFRFYDVRIALAFAMTLGPADANTFIDPNDALLVQMDVLSDVANDAFRDRFARYMREYWPEAVGSRNNAEINALVDQSLAAIDKIGATRSDRDILKMALSMLLDPGVENDADALSVAREFPRNAWTNIIFGTALTRFDLEGRLMAGRRVRDWESFE